MSHQGGCHELQAHGRSVQRVLEEARRDRSAGRTDGVPLRSAACPEGTAGSGRGEVRRCRREDH